MLQKLMWSLPWKKYLAFFVITTALSTGFTILIAYGISVMLDSAADFSLSTFATITLLMLVVLANCVFEYCSGLKVHRTVLKEEMKLRNNVFSSIYGALYSR